MLSDWESSLKLRIIAGVLVGKKAARQPEIWEVSWTHGSRCDRWRAIRLLPIIIIIKGAGLDLEMHVAC